ncbi:alpha/beta hydrolase [Brevibacterium ammoniilyticum]|uniref:Alpha/beta hydrolase n=1 Tax=Brevibacterium ammoniilyticum TaxID=1046555 RepID=A0ABP9UA85_9MICO
MTQPTLVLLHGAGETAAAWDAVIAALPLTWRVLAPDLGAAGETDDGRFALGAAVEAIGRQLPAERTVVLCGLSLGAMIAAEVAARDDSGCVQGLVLSGGQVRPPKRLMRLQRFIAERFVPESAFAGSGVTKRQVIAMFAAVEGLDLSAALPAITVPTGVWCGTRDLANRAAARELARGIPEAALSFVPGVGHEWHKSHPAAFAAHLCAFASDNGLATRR